MAAPVVSGVAGLLLAVNPSLTYAELRNRILLTADPDIYSEVINGAYIPPPPDGTTRIPLLGTGMVDAFSAVKNQETQDLPVVGHSDRVTIACGNIPAETGGLPLWFVVPIIAAAIYRMTCGRINRSKRD
jgi:subtilisin family serine protease